MVNMSVPFSRPDRALLTLRDEVYAAYGYTPARASEFVTGYKSPSNFTGHNADANGIVHAVDIFTDENGNLPEAKGRELAEKLRHIGAATNRFSYLIHDMSPGQPAPMIAGQFSNWAWVAYNGASPHSDHIHVSMCDMYWGDPAPVGADVYDSTEPWGIATVATASSETVTPISPEEDFMASISEFLNTPAYDGGKTISQFFKDVDERLARLEARDVAQYDATFNGGTSMPDGKPLKDLINDSIKGLRDDVNALKDAVQAKGV